MKTLSAKIFIRPVYNPMDDVELLVEFKNDSDKPIYISKNIAGAIARKGSNLRNTKSSKSRKVAFYKIPPGRSVVKKANPGKDPDLTEGKHELVFRLFSLEPHFKKAGGKGAITKLRVKSTKFTLQVGKPGLELPKKRVEADLLKKRRHANLSTPTQELGFAEASMEALDKLPIGLAGVLPCEVNGGTLQQTEDIKRAHNQAFAIAVNGLNKLGNDKNYRRWFGNHTTSRFERVRGTLQNIMQDFQNKTFVYEVNTNTGGDVVADAEFGNLTIELFKGFFHLLSGTHGGKASRIFHEHTHASGNTLDNAYSIDECLHLANNTPDGAVKNANSFLFFIEN